ncbi:MAG: sugar phosphate isomerase/epimerase [Acidobacteria bacterium]|nr:sugar phosphate isomerase/epimerase [Acidobacteriota bacterium]
MQRALSTHLFANQRLTRDLLQQIEDAGMPAIEIFCARQHFDYTEPTQVREVAAWFADHALELRSIHTPIYRDTEWGRSGARAVVNLAETEAVRRQEAVDEVKRALEVAERLPFRYAVVHLGVPQEEFAQKKFDAAYASLETLLPFARARGVELLVENIPNQLSTPQRLREFLAYTRLAELRVCFDTGHAHLMGGVVADFEALRELVVSTHVHDNRGQQDDHLFPFQGTIDWEAALRAFASAPQEFLLQFELRDYGEFSRPLEKALESFRRLEELALARQP